MTIISKSLTTKDRDRTRRTLAWWDWATWDCRWRSSSRHAGFSVTGIDVDAMQGRALSTAANPTFRTCPLPCSSRWCKAGKIRATTDFAAVAELDTINICVPTPLRKTKDPDMSYIVNACQEIAKHFHPGHAGDPGIHHLSRHHRRTDAADVRAAGPQGGRGLLPVLFAGARRSRQSQISDQQHSQSGGRHHAGVHAKWARCSTRRRSKPWCR